MSTLDSTHLQTNKENHLAIQETLYLFSIPGMYYSIKEGLVTDISECSNKLDW